jgi:hypothetical protein
MNKVNQAQTRGMCKQGPVQFCGRYAQRWIIVILAEIQECQIMIDGYRTEKASEQRRVFQQKFMIESLPTLRPVQFRRRYV